MNNTGMLRSMIFLYFAFAALAACSQRPEISRKDTANVQWKGGAKFFQYRVDKGETIYSITKKFGITEEELRASNPELEGGLKNKMLLLIPAGNVQQKKTTGDKQAEEKKTPSKELRIALMLPLKTAKALLADTVSEDTTQQRLNEETLSEMEFYEGALHAAEMLATGDSPLSLKLVDTENDSSRLNTLLKDPEMKNMDFIVAAGDYTVLRRISQFTSQHKIGLLTFTLNASEIVKASPYTYACTPSSMTQCFEAGRRCALKFANANALTMKTGSHKENERAAAFGEGWNDLAENKCKALDYSKRDFNALLAALSKDKNNVLFVPTTNEDFVNNLVTQLNDTTDVYELTVIGIPTWLYLGSIDPAVMQNLHAHLFSASHTEDGSAASIEFRKFFRKEYLCEPSESAYQGFDAIGLICRRLRTAMAGDEEPAEWPGFYSTYRFKMADGLHENQYIRLLRYEDYRMVEVK